MSVALWIALFHLIGPGMSSCQHQLCDHAALYGTSHRNAQMFRQDEVTVEETVSLKDTKDAAVLDMSFASLELTARLFCAGTRCLCGNKHSWESARGHAADAVVPGSACLMGGARPVSLCRSGAPGDR